MRKRMLACILIACMTTGAWAGWKFAVAWYDELGAEPVPPPRVKTYAELVGRQDCRVRDWNCMTGGDRFQTDPIRLAEGASEVTP